jgi:hypothetical protein
MRRTTTRRRRRRRSRRCEGGFGIECVLLVKEDFMLCTRREVYSIRKSGGGGVLLTPYGARSWCGTEKDRE